MPNRSVTPAFITYTPPGQSLQTIRFHSVISEDHEAQSQITQFPVQTGFQISNNSIRKNRRITISAVIVNKPIAGSATAYEYSSNNSKTIFDALEALVNAGQPCEVMTNLGIYNPVVFTRFKTKQQKGWTDAIEFTLSGEEVQVSATVNGTAPKILSFTKLTGAQADARADVLRNTGIEVCDCFEVSEAAMKLGEDFSVESKNEFGQTITTTYIMKELDPTTGIYEYEVHTSDVGVYQPRDPNVSGSVENVPDIGAGISGVPQCLVDTGTGVIEDAATDIIDTAMGELKKSIYGAVYDIVHLSSNEYGQTMIMGGIGCFVRGVTGEGSEFPWAPGEALPSTDEILDGAKNFGTQLFGKDEDKAPPKGEVLTQLQCCETG